MNFKRLKRRFITKILKTGCNNCIKNYESITGTISKKEILDLKNIGIHPCKA